MAYLLVTSGNQAGKSVQLRFSDLIAGRECSREFQLLDPKVSRRHFKIRRQVNRYVICELDSRNGIFVNGRQVSEAPLSDMDRITVGETELLFLASDEASQLEAAKRTQIALPAAADVTITATHTSHAPTRH
jgi:pSer/pThr/pTyr-binding forkhead associated (FHA) protein